MMCLSERTFLRAAAHNHTRLPAFHRKRDVIQHRAGRRTPCSRRETRKKFSANSLRMKLWITYSPLSERGGLHRSPPACSYSKRVARRYQIVSNPFRQELPHAGRFNASVIFAHSGFKIWQNNFCRGDSPARATTVPILLRFGHYRLRSRLARALGESANHSAVRKGMSQLTIKHQVFVSDSLCASSSAVKIPPSGPSPGHRS